MTEQEAWERVEQAALPAIKAGRFLDHGDYFEETTGRKTGHTSSRWGKSGMPQAMRVRLEALCAEAAGYGFFFTCYHCGRKVRRTHDQGYLDSDGKSRCTASGLDHRPATEKESAPFPALPKYVPFKGDALAYAVRNDPVAFALETRARQAEAEANGLRGAVEDLRGANSLLTKARDQANEALATAQHDLDELGVECDARGHKIAGLEGQVDKWRETCDKWQERWKEERAEVLRLAVAPPEQVTCCGCMRTIKVARVACNECSGRAAVATGQSVLVGGLLASLVLLFLMFCLATTGVL